MQKRKRNGNENEKGNAIGSRERSATRAKMSSIIADFQLQLHKLNESNSDINNNNNISSNKELFSLLGEKEEEPPES